MQELLVAGAIVLGVLNLVAGVLVSVIQLRRVGRPGSEKRPPPGDDPPPPPAGAAHDADRRAAMTLAMLRQHGDRRERLPAPDAARPDRAAVAGKNVLVVEDDLETRTMLALTLTLDGHAVRATDNAVDGLSLARREPDHLDLVLLDLGLATMNGFEFLVAQSSDPAIASIPVVVISGRTNFDDSQRSGAWVHTLHKPASADALADAVRRFAR